MTLEELDKNPEIIAIRALIAQRPADLDDDSLEEYIQELEEEIKQLKQINYEYVQVLRRHGCSV